MPKKAVIKVKLHSHGFGLCTDSYTDVGRVIIQSAIDSCGKMDITLDRKEFVITIIIDVNEDHEAAMELDMDSLKRKKKITDFYFIED